MFSLYHLFWYFWTKFYHLLKALFSVCEDDGIHTGPNRKSGRLKPIFVTRFPFPWRCQVDDGYIAQAGKSRTHQMRNHLDPPHTVSVASSKPHQIRRSPCSGSLSIPRPTPFLKSICNFVGSFVFWFAAILPAFSRSFSDSPSFAYDFLKGIRPHPRAVACRFDGRGSRAPTLPDRSDPIRGLHSLCPAKMWACQVIRASHMRSFEFFIPFCGCFSALRFWLEWKCHSSARDSVFF
jgi:hypothetical protein